MFEIDPETGEPILDKNGNPIPKKVATKAQQQLVKDNILNVLANNIGKPLERDSERRVASQIAKQNYEETTGGDYDKDVENMYSQGEIDINTQNITTNQKEIEQIELLQSKGLTTVVGADQYDLLAEQQHWTDKWANGIAKYGLNTLIHTAGGVGGLFYNLPAMIIDGEFKSFYDNKFNHLMEGLSEDVAEWLPNYVSREEAEYGFFRSLGTANFWANDFLGGMSFITGAVASGYLTAGLGNISKVASASRFISALDKTAKAGSLYNRTAAALNVGEKILGGGAKLLAGSGYEASLMANQFVKGGKEQFITEFENEYGRTPTEEELAAKMSELYSVGNGVFAANMALVNLSNMVALPHTFGPGIFKSVGRAKHAAKGNIKIASELGEEELKNVAKFRGTTLAALKKEIAENPNLKIDVAETWSPAKAALERFKKLYAPVTEMQEEIGQSWVDKSALNYVAEKYNEDGTKDTMNLIESMGEAFVETMGDSGAWKEGFIGLLLGGMGSPTFAFKNGAPKWQGGVYEAFKDPRKRDEIQTIAKILSQDEFALSRELLKATTKLNLTNEEFNQALESGDIFRSKNAEARQLFTIGAAYNQAGMLDVFTTNQINKIKELTTEEFRDEFGYENMTDEEVETRRNDVIKSFEKTSKNIQDSMDRASYFTDSKNERDLHEAISFSIFTSKNLDERETQLAEKLNKLLNTNYNDKRLRELSKLDKVLEGHQYLIKEYESLRDKILNNEQRINKKYKNLKRALNSREIEELEKLEKQNEENQTRIDKIVEELEKIKNADRQVKDYDRNIDSFVYDINEVLELRKELKKESLLPENNELSNSWEDLKNIAIYREQLITEYNWLVSKEGNKKLSEALDEYNKLKRDSLKATRLNERLEEAKNTYLNLDKDPKLRDLARYISLQQIANNLGVDDISDAEEVIKEEVESALSQEVKENISKLETTTDEGLDGTAASVFNQFKTLIQDIQSKVDNGTLSYEEGVKQLESLVKRIEDIIDNSDDSELGSKIKAEGDGLDEFIDKMLDLIDAASALTIKYKNIKEAISTLQTEVKGAVIDFPSSVGLMYSGFFNRTSEEFNKAYQYLSNNSLKIIKENIFLKFEEYNSEELTTVSKNNPAVTIHKGYNKKPIAAVLYVNTPEGPIKIGAVPDNRRFTVNGEPFNIDNYAHVTAINPAFTQLEGNTYILTGPGKDFRDLYKKMEAAYSTLDKFADQFSEGNPVTVDNKTLNEIFDFNQAFNFTQNYTREKLSELGNYADFEVSVAGGVVDGKRVRKNVTGKIIRISSNEGTVYKIVTPEGVFSLEDDSDKLIEELESIVSESFESGYMTFYKDIKEINNPNIPGRTIVKDSYKAIGLDLPNQENTPEFNAKFGEEFKVLTMQYEQARKELKEQFDTEGTVLNTLHKELQEAIKNNDTAKKKEISTRISNEKSTFFKSKNLDSVGKKWFFAVGRKEGAVEFPIQVRPSLQISQLANEVQFVFDLKSFYDSSNNKVNIKKRNKTTGKLSDLSIRLNVKSITESGVELYIDKEKKKSIKINSAEDLMNLINKRLASYEITDDNGIKIKVPHVMSINSNEGFEKDETGKLGELIPNRIKNPFNLSLVPRPENISRQTKPKTTVKRQKLSNPVVENKYERTKFDDVNDIGNEVLDFEGAEEITLSDSDGPDSIEMADQNATSSMFGVAPTQPKSNPKPQTPEQQKADIEKRRQESNKNQLNEIGSNRFLKLNKEGENTELSEVELKLINSLIDRRISQGKSAKEINAELISRGFIQSQATTPAQIERYLQSRIDGKINSKVGESISQEINAKYDAELNALNESPTSQPSPTESETEGKKKLYLEDSKVASLIKSIKAYKERLNKEGSLPEDFQESLDYQLDRLKGLGYTDEEIQKMVDDYIEPELPTFSHEELDPATQISIDTAKANLREILPANVSIQDIQNILSKLKANGVPMGAVWNKVLYLNKAIKSGTEYHEAFHFVFKYFLNNAQRNALLKAAQNKYGKPIAEQLKKIENETDLRKGLSEKELTNIYYEELLADGFMEYKKNPESPEVNKKYNGIKGLFKKLLDKIKAFFKINKENKKDLIDNLYEDISLGKFKNAEYLIEPKLKTAPVFTLLRNDDTILTFQESNRVINTISNITFTNPNYNPNLPEEDLRKLIINSIKEFRTSRLIIPSNLENSNISKTTKEKLLKFKDLITSEEVKEQIIQGVTDIIKYQTYDVLNEDGETETETEDVNLEENIDNGESWQTDITQIGGFNSLTKKAKNYLTTIIGSYDMFGILTELNLNEEEFSNEDFFKWGVNHLQLHNALTNLLKNSPKRLYFKRLHESAKTNKMVADFYLKFKSDISQELGISVDHNTPIEILENSIIYNTIVSAYEQVSTNYIMMMKDPSNTLYAAFNSDANDSSRLQVSTWSNNWIAKRVNKNNAIEALERILSILDPEKQSQIESVEKFETAVNELHNLLQSIQLGVSKGYVRMSLIQAKKELLDSNVLFEKSLLEELSSFPDFTGLNMNDVKGIIASLEKGGNPFERGQSTDSDEGALGRLFRIANNNAIFDETVENTTLRNAEGELIHKILRSNYMFTELKAFSSKHRIDILQDIMFNLLPEGKEDEIKVKLKEMLSITDSYVSDEKVNMLWTSIKNSSLLRGLTLEKDIKGSETEKITYSKEFARKYLEQLDILIMDGLKNTHFRNENNSLIEDSYKDSESFVYSRMSLSDKVFYQMALFAPGVQLGDRFSNSFRKKVYDYVNGKATERFDTFTPFVTQILEAKKTQVAINMPVQTLVTDGKVSDLLVVRLRNAMRNEVEQILNVKETSEKIVSGELSTDNLTKNFYFTNNEITINGEKIKVKVFGNKLKAFYLHEWKRKDLNPSQMKEVKTFPRGWDLFEWNHLEILNKDLYNSILDLVNNSENKNVTLSDFDNLITTNVVQDYYKAKLDSFIEFLKSPEVDAVYVKSTTESKIEETDGEKKVVDTVKQEIINKSLPEYYGQLGKEVNEDAIGNYFFNDFLNSIELNSLLHGPSSQMYKDFIDFVKRNGRMNASGPTIGNGSTLMKVKPSIALKDRIDKGVSNIKNPKLDGTDTTDAQSFGHLRYAFKYLKALGKNDKKTVDIYNRILKGYKLSWEEVSYLQKSKNTTRPLKLVGADREIYWKTSLAFIQRNDVSYLISDAELKELVNDHTYNKYELKQIADKFEREGKSKVENVSVAQLLSDAIYDKFLNNTHTKADIELLHKLWKPIPSKEYLHNELNEMEADNRDITAYDSAMKINTHNGLIRVADTSIREQVETSGIKTAIVHGTQLMNLITIEQDPDLKVVITDILDNDGNPIETTLGVLQETYNQKLAQRVEMGMKNFQNLMIKNTKVDKTKLIEMLNESLNLTAPSPYLQEILSYHLDGYNEAELVYDLNLPSIVEKVSQMFLAIATKEVFKHKVEGTKLTLKSDIGEKVMEATKVIKKNGKLLYNIGDIINPSDYKSNPSLFNDSFKTRRLGWRIEKNVNGKPTYYTEIKMTAQTALQYNLKIGDTVPEHLLEVFGVRIPTQDKHSMVYGKVVEFLPPESGNVVVLPAEIVYLSGADFDVDALYARFKPYWGKDNKPYGSYKSVEEAYEEYKSSMKLDKNVLSTIKKKKQTDMFDEDILTLDIEDGMYNIDDIEGDEVTSPADIENLKEKWNNKLTDIDLEDALFILGRPATLSQFEREYGNQVRENIKAYNSGDLLKVEPITKQEINTITMAIEKVMLYNESNKHINEAPATMDIFKETQELHKSHGINEDLSIKGMSDPQSKFLAMNANNVGQDNIGISAVSGVGFGRMSKYGIHNVPYGEYDSATLYGKTGFVKDDKGRITLSKEDETRVIDMNSSFISAATDNAKEQLAAIFNLTRDILGPLQAIVQHGISVKAVLTLSKGKFYRTLGQNIVKYGGDLNENISKAIDSVIIKMKESDEDLTDVENNLLNDLIESDSDTLLELFLNMSKYEQGDLDAFNSYVSREKATAFYNQLIGHIGRMHKVANKAASSIVLLSKITSLAKGLKSSFLENDSIDNELMKVGIEIYKLPGKSGILPSHWELRYNSNAAKIIEKYGGLKYDIMPILENDKLLKTMLQCKQVVTHTIASEIFISRTKGYNFIADSISANFNSFYLNSLKHLKKFNATLQSELTLRARALKTPLGNPSSIYEGVYDEGIKRVIGPLEDAIINLRNLEVNGEKPFMDNILLNSIKFTSTEVKNKASDLLNVPIIRFQLNQDLKNKPDFEKALTDASLALAKHPEGVKVLKEIINGIFLKDGMKYKSNSVARAIHPKLIYKNPSEFLKKVLPVFNKMVKEDGIGSVDEFESLVGTDLNSIIIETFYKYALNPSNSMALVYLDLPATSKISEHTALKAIDDLRSDKVDIIKDTVEAFKDSKKEDNNDLSEEEYKAYKDTIDSIKAFNYDKNTETLTVTARPSVIETLYGKDDKLKEALKKASKKILSLNGFPLINGKNMFPPVISVNVAKNKGERVTLKFYLAELSVTGQKGSTPIDISKHDFTKGPLLGDTGIYKPISPLGIADFEFGGNSLTEMIDFNKKAKNFKVEKREKDDTTETPSTRVDELSKNKDVKGESQSSNSIPTSFSETNAYNKGANYLLSEGYTISDIKVIGVNDIKSLKNATGVVFINEEGSLESNIRELMMNSEGMVLLNMNNDINNIPDSKIAPNMEKVSEPSIEEAIENCKFTFSEYVSGDYPEMKLKLLPLSQDQFNELTKNTCR